MSRRTSCNRVVMLHLVVIAGLTAVAPHVASAALLDDRIAHVRAGTRAHAADAKLFDPRMQTPATPVHKPQIASGSTTIGFEDLAVGSTLGSQYASLGVIFSPDDFEDASTDLTVVSSTGADVGALGLPNLVSGNIVHSFGGWLNEISYANVLATLTDPVGSVSVDFAGNGSTASGAGTSYFPSELVALDADLNVIQDVIATPNATATYQTTLTVSSTTNNIAYVGIFVGDFDDWVGFDNFSMTVLSPEPASLSTLALSGLIFRRRR